MVFKMDLEGFMRLHHDFYNDFSGFAAGFSGFTKVLVHFE